MLRARDLLWVAHEEWLQFGISPLIIMCRQNTECEAGRQNETRTHRHERYKISAGLIQSTANTWTDDQAQAEAGLHTREHCRHLSRNIFFVIRHL